MITREYPTIEKLMAATVEDLAAIHEIGDAIAASVHQFCHSDYGQQTFAELAELGVELHEPQTEQSAGESPISGKSIVVTGTLQHFKRDEIKGLIEKLGGRAASTVSKKTDFVIAGEKAGSKLTKAQELGVQVMTENEFKELIES